MIFGLHNHTRRLTCAVSATDETYPCSAERWRSMAPHNISSR